MKTHLTILAALTLASSAWATPRETITITNQDINGLRGDATNTVLHPTLVGGYILGKITYTGTLTSATAATWRSDTRIELVSPAGDTVTIRPFLTGSTYSSLAVSGQVFFSHAIDPAGVWTVRLYETFDDGGAPIVDARLTSTITLTDDPPSPPTATNLGTLTSAGFTSTVASLPRNAVAWFSFLTTDFVCQGGPLFVDLDTFGSVTQVTGSQQFADDTVLALYDSLGNLVAKNDDDCGGLAAQLSFGSGTGVRPPISGGEPFTGSDGCLPPGRYYAAVGAAGVRFDPIFWGTVNDSTQITAPVVLHVRSNFGLVTPCPADFDCDGTADFFDYDAYVTCFEGGPCPTGKTADFDGDGTADFFDYDAFVVAFESPC